MHTYVHPCIYIYIYLYTYASMNISCPVRATGPLSTLAVNTLSREFNDISPVWRSKLYAFGLGFPRMLLIERFSATKLCSEVFLRLFFLKAYKVLTLIVNVQGP